MTTFLRWASALVLLALAGGAFLAYPQLRERLTSVPTATPSATVAVAVTTATSLPPQGDSPLFGSTRRAIVIQAPPTVVASPTGLPTPTLTVAGIAAPGIPVAVATTSLLPMQVALPIGAAPTQQGAVSQPNSVLATPSPTWTPSLTWTPFPTAVGPTATATVTPITLGLSAPEGGAEEKGGRPAADIPATPLPVDTRATTGPVPPSSTLTPPTLTPTPDQFVPRANRAGSLHIAPDASSAIVGSFSAGDPLDIVARFTQGTWYLLTNGLWIAAEAVVGAPLHLPLVVPTATPTLTPTPTPTYTPLPTVPPQPETTPVPVATSLAQPVCACDAQTYSCVSVDFPDRAAAQACFEYCFRIRGFDVHNLDANLNGQACENLPTAAP